MSIILADQNLIRIGAKGAERIVITIRERLGGGENLCVGRTWTAFEVVQVVLHVAITWCVANGSRVDRHRALECGGSKNFMSFTCAARGVPDKVTETVQAPSRWTQRPVATLLTYSLFGH